MNSVNGAFLLFPIGAAVLITTILFASIRSEAKTVIDLLLDVFSTESTVLIEADHDMSNVDTDEMQ